jgi:hypothetical protein
MRMIIKRNGFFDCCFWLTGCGFHGCGFHGCELAGWRVSRLRVGRLASCGFHGCELAGWRVAGFTVASWQVGGLRVSRLRVGRLASCGLNYSNFILPIGNFTKKHPPYPLRLAKPSLKGEYFPHIFYKFLSLFVTRNS